MSPHSQSHAQTVHHHRNCIAPASVLALEASAEDTVWSTVAQNEELDLGWGDDAYSRATTPVPPNKEVPADQGPNTLPGPKLEALVEEEKEIAKRRPEGR